MYIDDSVVASLIIIALTCIMGGYVGVYAYRHFKEDVAKNESE